MTESTATAAPAFSFAGLSIEDAHVPKITRESSAKDNPFAAVVLDSYKLPGDEGKKITVPAERAPEAVYLLRTAATVHGLGLRLAMQDKNGSRLNMGSEGGQSVVKNGKARTVGSKAVVVREDGKKFGGNVTIIFKGKDRKERKSPGAVTVTTAPPAVS